MSVTIPIQMFTFVTEHFDSEILFYPVGGTNNERAAVALL